MNIPPRLLRLAPAVLALAALAGPAHASPTYREWTDTCGGASPVAGMTTCVSMQLWTDFATDTATLWIKNESGLFGSYRNLVFNTLSFFNGAGGAQLPDVIEGPVSTMTGPYRSSNSSNPPPVWSVKNVPGAGGAFGLDFDAGVNGNDGAIGSSCADSLPGGSNDLWMSPTCGSGGLSNVGDGWVKMSFGTVGDWDLDATNTQFQLHAQGDLGGVKCTSSFDCAPVDGPLQPADVPEPSALALIGLGLAGVAASRRSRRAASRTGSAVAASA